MSSTSSTARISPYGGESRAELLAAVQSTIERLESYSPTAVVVASNAPSIMVLDDLMACSRTPLVGVFPPVRRALKASVTKRIALLGVASLIVSPEITAYVEREAAEQGRVSEPPGYDLADFQRMLGHLGLDLAIERAV